MLSLKPHSQETVAEKAASLKESYGVSGLLLPEEEKPLC